MAKQQPIVEVGVGDWVSAYTTTLRGPSSPAVTGKVIKGPHTVSYVGWLGLVATVCVEIENWWGVFTVPVEDVIEKIDPVATWQRLRPGESIPKWLIEHLDTPKGGNDDE